MSASAQAPRNRISWLRWVGTLAALLLLLYLLKQQGWQEIWQAVQRVSLWRLLAALLLMIISRLAVCGRWHVLLRSAGLPIPWSESMRVTFAGLFASNFLPTTIGGDVVRLAGLAQLRYDPALGAASLITDRLVGMAGMALFLPFGLPSLLAPPNTLGITSSPSCLALVPVADSPASAAGVSAGYPENQVNRPAFSRLERLRQKVLSWFWRILAALKLWLQHPAGLVLALLFTTLHMVCVFSLVALFLQGLNEPLSFFLIGGLYSISYFITLIPISINGYGLQEISLTFVYSTLAGVSLSSSLTIALLYRTITMLVSLPGAWFAPALLEAQEKP